MHYHGSCHCGTIRFDVEGELTGAMSCNCSICRRKGALLWFVPRDHLRLATPDEQIATYTFNRHLIKHRFCPTCGIHTHGEGVDQQGRAMAAINIRCLDDVDLDAVGMELAQCVDRPQRGRNPADQGDLQQQADDAGDGAADGEEHRERQEDGKQPGPPRSGW